MTVGELVWKVKVDPSGAQKGFNQTENGLKKSGASFAKWAKAGVVAAGIIAGVKGIAKVSKALVKAGSDAEETRSKFNTVFSSMQGSAGAAARNLSENFGLSSKAAQKLLGDTGDLLTGFGFTQKSALDLSSRVNTLAVDLASFTNAQGGSAAVSAALTKALTGETESLKSYGIVIQQNSKAFKDQVKQIQKTQGVTEQQAKSQVILNEAYKQSKNAVGDFGRTQDSFANQQRIAQARIDDLIDSLGVKLLPAAKIGAKAFNEVLAATNDFVQNSGAIDKAFIGLTGGFKVLKEIGVTFFTSWKNSMSEAFSPLADLFGKAKETNIVLEIMGGVVQALASVYKVLGSILKLVVQAVVDLGISIFKVGELVADWFMLLSGKKSAKEFKQTVDDVKDSFENFGQNIVDNSVDVWDTVSGEVQGFVVNTKSQVNELTEAWQNGQQDAQDAIDETNKELKDQAEAAAAVAEAASEVDPKGASEFSNALGEAAGEWESISDINKMATVTEGMQTLGEIALSIGEALIELNDALYAQKIEQLDAEMEKELEASGVAEKTAVEEAQAELAAAKEEGDAETILEAENALKKAEIEEKYQQKKAQLEYENNVASWELQLAQAVIQGITAPLNAFVSTLAIPIVGPILAPIAAAAAAVTAGLQVAAISAAKPTKPSFAVGAVNLPSDTDAIVHAGEMIVPKTFAEGVRSGELSITGGGSSSGNLRVNVILDGKIIAASTINKYVNNGVYTISARGMA